MNSDISLVVRRFIAENFFFRDDLDDFADDASFLEEHIFDSTGLLELVSFVEKEYGIAVPDEDMLPENFGCIQAVTSYVRRRLNERTVKRAA
jgi:acyl carrier protein